MKNLGETIEKFLIEELGSKEIDLVDFFKVEKNKDDKQIDLKTTKDLQSAINDFEHASDDSVINYVVQVRQRKEKLQAKPVAKTVAEPPAPVDAESKPEMDDIYLPNGKLNTASLEKNALILLSSGEIDLARNIFSAMLASGENTAKAQLGLGKCHEESRDYESAQRCYEEAVAYFPTLDTYECLIGILIKRKKDKNASEVIERALHIGGLSDKNRFELHKACGNCLMRMESVDAAEKHYNEALSLDPTADGIQSNLGSLYLQAGRVQDAKTAFQLALDSNPVNDKAQVGLGCCFIAEKNKVEAHDQFLKALEIEIRNPTAIYYLVKCAYELKIYEPAEQILVEYMDLAPINANLLYSLAGLQFHLGKTESAKATSNRILEIKPDHAGAKNLLKMMGEF